MNLPGETALSRWERDFPGRSALGQELVRRYGSVSRSYHDARHLIEVLDAVDAMAAEADDIDAVRLAAWFHDAVYDVRAGDNEQRSAELAESVLPAYDVDEHTVAEVVRLVRLTESHDPEPGDNNGSVLCDADLAILASDEGRYATYVDGVRAEYRHVDDRTFAIGRAAVLRHLLGLTSLYRTKYGQATWEPQARANVQRELEELTY
ncbi:MAG TPA: metal-dependent phosphohydrolase [Nocardioidaceae bacterium]